TDFYSLKFYSLLHFFSLKFSLPNVPLESSTNKLIEKLNQEKDSQEEALEEFNSTLDNVLEKLSHENIVQMTFMVLKLIGKMIIKMANDQAEALSDQEVADDCLDDEQVKERRPSKRIRVTQEKMVKDKKPKKG
ncbi:hypothetical protein Tco_0182472, partial [Tanacetum coccineum]